MFFVLPRFSAKSCQIRQISAKKKVRSDEIQTNFLKFEEARRNPGKKTKPLSGQKVPFREQASPTIGVLVEAICYGL